MKKNVIANIPDIHCDGNEVEYVPSAYSCFAIGRGIKFRFPNLPYTAVWQTGLFGFPGAGAGAANA